MTGKADAAAPPATRRGFMFGELLVAVFLLAIAISSVTALMYSVGRHPRARAAVDCKAKGSARSPECAVSAKTGAAKTRNAGKLLVAGCARRTGSEVQECEDSATSAGKTAETVLRSRTDSASRELLPKKARRTTRPDLGFVR